PVYPVNSVGEGVVILALRVSPEGVIQGMQVIRDVPSLTEPARNAVAGWKFTPARRSGVPVAGTAIVAISFLRPIVN
ncbi:MAG TPA: energy transducer TonB, partial [Terriglobia bacterium]|nr:energy transducer TonB [Terriglobia bacterium]